MTNSFQKYIEVRSAFSPIGAVLDEFMPIGGFVSGVNYPISEAENATGGVNLISKTPILFDEDDIKFIMQFPPSKWAEALAWRYGHGLKWASEEMDKNGEIPENANIFLAHQSGDMTFEAKTHNMSELFNKLTKPRDDGGLYGFILHKNDWRYIEVDEIEADDKPDKEKSITPKGQWHTRNYEALTRDTARNIMYRWRNGTINGFLGKSDSAHWIDSNEGEGLKKTGAPPRKILLSWDGKILNQRGGDTIPVFSPEEASKFLDSHALRASESGKPAMAVYKFKTGDEPREVLSTIPVLFPGQIFQRQALTAFDDHQDNLKNLLFSSISGTPLEKQPVIDPSELSKHISKAKAEEIIEFVNKARLFLPSSGAQEAAKTMTPEEFTNFKLDAKAQGIVTKGGYEPSKQSKQQEPVTAKMLKKIGVSRKEYEEIVKKHFISANTHNVDVMGPDGAFVKSPIWRGIAAGVNGEAKRTSEEHAQLLAEEIPTMFEYAKAFFIKNIGLPLVQNFVSIFIQNEKDDALVVDSWQKVATYAHNKAAQFVREISQLDLGVGTRAERRSGLKITSSSDIEDDKMVGASNSQEIDPKTGERVGITRSVLDAERGVGKKILNPRSTIDLRGSHADTLWKIADDLKKLKKIKAKEEDEDMVSSVRDEMKVRNRMIDFHTEQIMKHNPTMDRILARNKAIMQTREDFKTNGLLSSDTPIDIKSAEKKTPTQTPVVKAPARSEPNLFDIKHLEGMVPQQREEHFSSPAFYSYLMANPPALAAAEKEIPRFKSKVLAAVVARIKSEIQPMDIKPKPNNDDDDFLNYRKARA